MIISPNFFFGIKRAAFFASRATFHLIDLRSFTPICSFTLASCATPVKKCFKQKEKCDLLQPQLRGLLQPSLIGIFLAAQLLALQQHGIKVSKWDGAIERVVLDLQGGYAR